MKVSIVTYASAVSSCKCNEFREAYMEHQDAVNDATEDMVTKLATYKLDAGAREVEVVEREVHDQPSVVRIINPHNGHEYEAFIITEKEVL